jgi:hypothetical protein
MVAWIAIPVAAAIVGTGITKKFFPETTWAESAAFSLLSTLVVSTIRAPTATATRTLQLARFLFPFIRTPVVWIFKDLIIPAARPLVGGVIRSGAAILGSKTALYTAAAMAGYATGAVVGTTIISQLEKRGKIYEGATSDVLDFYLLGYGPDEPGTSETSRDRSAWYESNIPILNIPGDVRYIGLHYWNRATD